MNPLLTSPDPRSTRCRLAFLAATAVTVLAALLARLAGAGEAFQGGELVTLDGDSLYHLHRIRLVAEQFPRVPFFDPTIAWPDGGPIPWAAGFDVLGAALLWFGRATGGALGADLWVASLCPLLGAAVVAATMDLVHTLAADFPARRSATLAAGVIAAAVPQGIAASRFGRIDHHVAEALAMVLLARWALGALPPRAEAEPGPRLGFEAAGAVLSAGAVWVFTGSPLYVALVVPVLLGAVLLAPRPALVGSGGPGLLAGGALAALLSAPAVEAHGRTLAFGFSSWLQPLLLVAAGVAVCGAVLAGGRAAPGWPRAGAALLATAGIAALGAVIKPAGAAQAWAALHEWLFKADPWIARIDEFQPLLGFSGGPVAGVNRTLGAAGFAAPAVLALGGVALGRTPGGRPRAFAFAGLAIALALLTLLQMRFGRIFVPFLAASAGLGLAWVATLLAKRSRVARALPLGAALALAALDPRVRASMGLHPDPRPDAAVEASLFLRGCPPGASPGVLAPWDLGHHVLVLGDHPVVATGFGPYPDPAAHEDATRAFMVGEDELVALLSRRRVGWVVGGATNLSYRVSGKTAELPFTGRKLSARWLAEVPSAPLLLGGSAVPELGVRHFAHLRPVFASTRVVRGIDVELPVLWVFEVVPGARLAGRAPPGTRVVLEIPLVEHGRRHGWRSLADAGPDGRWAMTVPVPTELTTAALATGPGSLRFDDQPTGQVAIPEAAVREGRAIAVPAPSLESPNRSRTSPAGTGASGRSG